MELVAMSIKEYKKNFLITQNFDLKSKFIYI